MTFSETRLFSIAELDALPITMVSIHQSRFRFVHGAFKSLNLILHS